MISIKALTKGYHSGSYDLITVTRLLILLPLTILFIAQLIGLAGWRMNHDTPILHYIAFMIHRYDYAPYRDLFDMNMPGAYLFHMAIGKTVGYGDVGFRLIDIGWLIALLAITWGLMQRFGKWVAWASVVLFGLSYLARGSEIGLQRDYVGILPIAAAVLIVAARARPNVALQAFWIGVLFGLSTSLKPHLAIGLPLVLFFQWRQVLVSYAEDSISVSSIPIAWKISIFCLGGYVIPILGCLLWLYQQGSLPYFWEMISSYLPLYTSLTGNHQTIFETGKVIKYLIKSYLDLGGRSLWLLPACLGVFISLFESSLPNSKKNVIHLLTGLTFLYSVYPVISGQFWDYHWMPFQYFVIMLASLTLVPMFSQRNSLYKRLFPIAVLAITLLMTLHPPGAFLRQIQGLPPVVPKEGRVDELTAFLSSNLRPGDRVQPLDWTGGAVHAMLESRAEIATPFIYDFYFYHHVSQPYIQILRQRFIESLEQTKPRFIIEMTETPRVMGLDTTRDFRELRDILDNEYIRFVEGNGYVIHERLGIDKGN